MLEKRRRIAWRAVQNLANGVYVNLGIGLPTLVSDFIPADCEMVLHSENGVLGVGLAPRRQRDRLGSDQCRLNAFRQQQ